MLITPPAHFVKRLKEYDPTLRCVFCPEIERFVIEKMLKTWVYSGKWQGNEFFLMTDCSFRLWICWDQVDHSFRLPYEGTDIEAFRKGDLHRYAPGVPGNLEMQRFYEKEERKRKKFRADLYDVAKQDMAPAARKWVKDNL